MNLKTGTIAKSLMLIAAAVAAIAYWFLEAADDPLIVGTNVWPGYEPAHIADARGMISRDHVRVEGFPSASNVMEALRRGDVDAGALTLDEVIHLENQGLEMTIILIADISHGGDAVIMRGDADWENAQKTLRIGVEATALGAYMLHRFVENREISRNRITVISLEQPALEDAFVNAQLDGVVTFDPVRSRLLAKGGVEVFSSREIPGEIIDVVAIRTDRLKEKLAKIEHFKTGWGNALDWMRDDRSGALSWLANRMNLTEAQADLALQQMRLPNLAQGAQMMQKDGLVEKDINNLVKVMINEGLIDANCVCEPDLLVKKQ